MGSRAVNINTSDNNKVVNSMPSYAPPLPTSSAIGIEVTNVHPSRIPDIGALEQSLGFRVEDAINLSRNPVFHQMKSNSQALGADVQFGALNKPPDAGSGYVADARPSSHDNRDL